MKPDKMLRVLKSAALAGVLTAALSGSALAQQFNASIWFPDTHPLTKYGYLDWAEDLTERSGGELEPRVFTGTALLDPASHLSGVRDGIVQVAYHAGTFTPSDLPVDNVLAQLAFSYSDYFLDAFAFTDMNMTDPATLEEWSRNGVVFGGGYATVPYVLMCNTPVETLEDIRGKKVRMPGSAHSNWATSVGAVPVNIASSEMYSGLEKGILDCAANGINELKTRSLWEVAHEVTMTRLGVYYAGYQYGFNKDFWADLNEDQRRMMLDSIADAMARTAIGYVAEADAVAAEAESQGVTIRQPADELAQSISDYASKARADAIALGETQFNLEESEAIVVRFEEKIEKWRGLLDGVDRTDEAAVAGLLKRELFDKIDVATYGID